MEVIVNDHAITSLSLADPDENLTTMHPLLAPTVDSLNRQICETQDLSQVTYSSESRYTSLVLLEAIKASLEKAKPTAYKNLFNIKRAHASRHAPRCASYCNILFITLIFTLSPAITL